MSETLPPEKPHGDPLLDEFEEAEAELEDDDGDDLGDDDESD